VRGATVCHRGCSPLKDMFFEPKKIASNAIFSNLAFYIFDESICMASLRGSHHSTFSISDTQSLVAIIQNKW
jgi:hypothetical protein